LHYGSCPLTEFEFWPGDLDGRPILVHVIPNSVHGRASIGSAELLVAALFQLLQPDTPLCIAMFAGHGAVKLIRERLNGLGNVMNLEVNTHNFYDDLYWGIEAKNENGKVRVSSLMQ
jgi:hypothetical protein